jgi:hypothetical protein
MRGITDVGEVDTKRPGWDDIDEFPAVFVQAAGEEYEAGTGNNYRSEMVIHITGAVNDEDSPEEAIDDHLEDIIQGLEALTDTYDRAWFLVELIRHTFQGKYGIFELRIRLDYEFTVAAP